MFLPGDVFRHKQNIYFFSHLQKQVTQIQKDIQRLITVPAKRTNTRLRKLSSTTGSKPKSKKGKPLKATKARKGSNRSRL